MKLSDAPRGQLGPLGVRGSAVFVALLVGLGLAIAWAGALVALVAPAAFGALGLAVLLRLLAADDEIERGRIIRWTTGAFIAHLSISVVITKTPFLLQLLGPDALTYHDLARAIVRHWTDGFPLPYVPSGKDGFYYLLAGLYWVFGATTVAGLGVNAAFAAGLVPLVTDTTRRLYGPSAARYAAPLTVVVPGVLVWTSQLLKEAAVLFLLALAVNFAVRIVQRISVVPLAGLAGAMAVLFTFRGWVGVMAAGGIAIGIVFGRRELLRGLGSGVTAVALLGALVVVTGLGYSGYSTAVGSDLALASEVRRDNARSARSGYDSNADISTPARALTYLPRALTTFLLGPFPWQIRSARQLIVVPDMLVWWALLPSLWRGMRGAARQHGRQVLLLLMPALTTSVLLALTVGNLGLLLRERTQVYVLLLPFFCLGLSMRNPRKPIADDASGTPLSVADLADGTLGPMAVRNS